MKYRLILLAALLVISLVAIMPFVWRVKAVSGTVTDHHGRPLSGAAVRIKATGIATTTDTAGFFSLAGFTPSFGVGVTAWQSGYYIGGADARPWDPRVEIHLSPYSVDDNKEYVWEPPDIESRSAIADVSIQLALSWTARLSLERTFLPLAESLTLGCRDCHGQAIYDQWASSSHALGSKNRRFLTMYNGTDIHGNRGRSGRFGHNHAYGSVLLQPDPNQPDYGPGYKLDFPDLAGNCSICHLPTAALEEPYNADPNQVMGVDALGTHCDFCHKIVAVKLNPATGLPYENLPGILSYELMRPQSTSQLFFGPYDDVDVGPDTYLPLMRQSEICAPCHSGSFWGVPIYQSFAEWRASPYADKGITCQSCHMKPDGVTTNFAPSRGGLHRQPETIPTHTFPGADETLLRNAISMEVRGRRQGDQIVVTIEIINDKTGHHIPTGSPLRHLILKVQATDDSGHALAYEEGPTIPGWCGVGDPADGYYAGLPGTAFAKILQDLWRKDVPTGAYWVPTQIISDTRIAAYQSASSTYAFAAPGDGSVKIEIELLYRRAFIDLMDKKGWSVPDIPMAERSILLR